MEVYFHNECVLNSHIINSIFVISFKDNSIEIVLLISECDAEHETQKNLLI